MGRRFCECRSQDFIPKSDEHTVVLAYSMSDVFKARSFDARDGSQEERIRDWLEDYRAIAYILVSLHYDDHQAELPAPIGRPRQRRLSIAAATSDKHSYATFAIENRTRARSVKLVQTDPARDLADVAASNLFLRWYDDEAPQAEAAPKPARFEFADFMGAC